MTAIISSFDLNSSTTTLLSSGNGERRGFVASNNSQHDVWLKPQAETVDDDKKGILLLKQTMYTMPVVYNGSVPVTHTGPISAIADTGTPTISVVEY